ncbi:PKD domain-containing protein [Flavobacterium gelidilacus]|uniref:PKD domain-containing protein n=1 Tax=Flavobacterium gelidilacus TaxID=206041 RepID=UPI0004007F29|nr:PKD domain-containing protein [Flavobacterium gelidilacus]
MFILEQFKKYFDLKVLLLFASILMLSIIAILFKYTNDEECEINDFNIEADSFVVGDLIIFSENSKNANSWRWYFGDSTQISFRSKVAHSFENEGEYIVKLIVNNKCKIEKLVKILPRTYSVNKRLMPKFNLPSHILEGETLNFKDNTEGSKSWEWRFGESNKIDSFDKNASYAYSIPGKKTVSLVVNGDYKHVAIKEIFVIPKKEVKEKREKYKSDVPWNPFQNVQDAPTEEPEKEPIKKVVRGPEIKDTDNDRLIEILKLVREDKITYDNFLKYFCVYNLPVVVYKDAETSSVKDFYYAVKKNNVKIKEVKISKDADDCIRVITITDKKYKSVF